MNHISDSRKITLADNLSLTEVDEEMVILNLKTGSYYGVNHIGAELLKDIQAGVEFNASVLKIAEKYQRPTEEVISDIEQLLDELEQQNLVVMETS